MASIQVSSGGSYSVKLPEGDYTVVASSSGKTTQLHSIHVDANGTTTLDVSL